MTHDDAVNPTRLDDFLNGHAADRGIDPAVGETVRRLHALDARDHEPDPRPGYLIRLQEDLMNQALSLPSAVSRQPPSAFRLPPSAAPPRRRVSPNFAAAAIILLTLAAGFLAYQFAPSGPGETPTLPAAAHATPEAPPTDETTAVDIAECAMERRPDGTVTRFAGEYPGSESLLPQYNARGPDVEVDEQSLRVLLDRPVADPRTYAAVSDTVRQLTACRFYATPFGRPPQMAAPDLDGRYFALFSDAWFRRELDDRGSLYAYWAPAGPTARVVETVRQMGPERAVAVFASAPGQAPRDRTVAIFSKQGDRWLIDELAPITSSGEALILDILVWDDGAFIPLAPNLATVAGYEPLPANEHVTITLANLGTKQHRFDIPALGVSTQAPPGHSVTFVIAPTEGTYEATTAAIGDNGQAIQTSTSELTFVWKGEGTPMPQG